MVVTSDRRCIYHIFGVPQAVYNHFTLSEVQNIISKTSLHMFLPGYAKGTLGWGQENKFIINIKQDGERMIMILPIAHTGALPFSVY